MDENRVRRILQICLGIILVLTVIPVMPFNESLVENVSAGSSWLQTTAQDFTNGTLTNTTVTPTGEVKLALQTKYVEDDFTNGAKIGDTTNIEVDIALDEARLIKFNKTFGGNESDESFSVQQTSDGGFILTGDTVSYGSVNATAWLIKTDNNGIETWNNTYGGSSVGGGKFVQQTSDGGFIFVGDTGLGAGSLDVWLVKTNSSGVEQWNKTFGGLNSDQGFQVRETSDGGYIIVGHRNEFLWLIKTNSSGNEQWNNTFGGSFAESGRSVRQTIDGGYIIAGSTFSIGPGWDIWLIRTLSNGTKIWDYKYGGNDHDYGRSVQQTLDGGFIIGGFTSSYGAGANDVWLIKTNENGSMIWNKTFGGSDDDTGYLVEQTSDSGYIITGYTNSFGTGNDDVWLIKTDNSGNEEWNKTFGGGSNDKGYSVEQTIDNGYIITGNTDSFGAGDYDAWLLKTDQAGNIEFPFGEFNSTNLLAGQEASLINTFNCTTAIQPGCSINVQFSTDSTNWYDSIGIFNDWDLLSNDFNSIDLSTLDWQGGNFYYRMNFTSDTIDAPSVQYINVSYKQYLYNGTIESQPFDAGANVNWTTIEGAFNIIEVLKGFTDIKIQLRTTTAQPGLVGKNFIGPDGTNSTYYDSPSTNIWSGHDSDQWIQYIAYLSTPGGDGTPLLLWVTISYNHYPSAPNLITPVDEAVINDNAPTLNWSFNDMDGIQGGFHVLVDDDNGFGSVNHDSGEVISGTQSYTLGAPLTDGTWYWKVRTQDNDGDWGLYSGFFSFTILSDATSPNPFIPTADYDSWTSDTQFDIYFSTTDAGSGIDYYEVSTDNGSFSIQSSPYTLPTQTEGVHNITVRAYDIVGNFVDGYIDIFIDTSPPSISHNPVTDATVGVPINITTMITDAGSGVQDVYLYYKKSTASTYTQLLMSAMGNDYEAQIPGSAVTSDGLEYYIKAEDSAATPNAAYYSAAGQTSTVPTASNDIDISISAEDLVSPSITSHSPTDTNVPVDTTITATFSEAMDQAATQSAFSISPSVVDSFSWVGNQLVFTPTADLEYNTIYNLTIGTGATDLAGNSLQLYSWEFTTIPGTTTGPEVDEYAPEETGVPVEGTVIEMWFSEDMDRDTTEDAISITPHIEVLPTWPRGDQIRLTPVDPLEYDKKYTVTISTNATNDNGQLLIDGESWSFYTEKAPKEGFDWDTWEPIVTILTILVSAIAFLIGFLSLKKKRGKLRKYMERVDNTFNEYKKNYQECEKELITLRENIKKEVKDGKIEENHFLILDKKIDDYLREMKALEKGGAVTGAVSVEGESGGELKDAEDTLAKMSEPEGSLEEGDVGEDSSEE